MFEYLFISLLISYIFADLIDRRPAIYIFLYTLYIIDKSFKTGIMIKKYVIINSLQFV